MERLKCGRPCHLPEITGSVDHRARSSSSVSSHSTMDASQDRVLHVLYTHGGSNISLSKACSKYKAIAGAPASGLISEAVTHKCTNEAHENKTMWICGSLHAGPLPEVLWGSTHPLVKDSLCQYHGFLLAPCERNSPYSCSCYNATNTRGIGQKTDEPHSWALMASSGLASTAQKDGPGGLDRWLSS